MTRRQQFAHARCPSRQHLPRVESNRRSVASRPPAPCVGHPLYMPSVTRPTERPSGCPDQTDHRRAVATLPLRRPLG
jgi:hypothetical protein